MKKISTIILAGLLSLISFPAKAIYISNPDPNIFASFPDNTANGVLSYIIVHILLPLAGTIAVLFIIIGGYQYMTAGMNEEMAEQGKKTLQNAIIGLVVVILSYLIINLVITTVFQAGS